VHAAGPRRVLPLIRSPLSYRPLSYRPLSYGPLGRGPLGRGPLGRRQRQQPAPVPRSVRWPALSRDDLVEQRADIWVIVEADHLGLWKRLGKIGTVPFRETAGRHDRTAGLSRRQQLADGVLLRGLDETAGVDENDTCVSIRIVGIVGGAVRAVAVIVVTVVAARADQRPASSLEPRREFLGVDLVARAAERDHADGPVLARLSGWRCLAGLHAAGGR
jgi:hypothetical protein